MQSGTFVVVAIALGGLLGAVRRWVLGRGVLDAGDDGSSHTETAPRAGEPAIVAVVLAAVSSAADFVRVFLKLTSCAAKTSFV